MVSAVVSAFDSRVKHQFIGQKMLDGCIHIAAYAAVQLNARLRQGLFGAAANPAANQRIHLGVLQKTSQGAVPIASSVKNGGRFDFPSFHVVYLETLGMAKMLEYLSIFISYRDSHTVFSFRHALYGSNNVRSNDGRRVLDVDKVVYRRR